MVEVGGSRLLQLSCGSREFGQSPQFSAAGDSPLDACASASQSKAPDHLASPRRSCGSLASPTCHPSSLSQPALRRHTSEVRAACSNPARADPCGGRQATGVPTATPKNGPDSRSTEPGLFFCYWHPEIVEDRRVRCELPRTPFERCPIRDLIGSVNSSALLAIYPSECYAGVRGDRTTRVFTWWNTGSEIRERLRPRPPIQSSQSCGRPEKSVVGCHGHESRVIHSYARRGAT